MTTTCPSKQRPANGSPVTAAGEDPIVVVDTREQRPYRFESSVRRVLETGDYSIDGLEDRVAVERKSKSDAYCSLGIERERFEREITRLAKFDYGAVVVEASLRDFLHAPEFSKLNPRSAMASLLAWSVRYKVHVIFAGDRRHGNAVTAKLLEKFWQYHRRGSS